MVAGRLTCDDRRITTSIGTGPSAASAASAGPRLYRAQEGRALAGVAAGIARHIGVPAIAVRLAFLALVMVGGIGVLLYAVFWAVLPVDPSAGRPHRRDTAQLVAFVAIGLGIQLMLWLAGYDGNEQMLGWLVAVIAVGAGIIWHQADPERRRRWARAMPNVPWLAPFLKDGDRRALAVRVIGGSLLVLTGICGVIIVLPVSGASGDVLNGLLFTLLAVAGLAVVFAPLVWRVLVQLRAEKEARIREQERAELAAMVHDQVLHTLALIQRNAGDARSVTRLARGQERTLRNWLYKPTGSPAERFAAAMDEAAAEVEDSLAITVDTVLVGDCAVDERVGAVVAAAREAMVNAGKHAKVQTVSLYAEVEADQLSVFVRDRGVGFDVAAVDDDRHGIRGSIRGRMERHGGRADVLSTPGEGTEVRLHMPLEGGDR